MVNNLFFIFMFLIAPSFNKASAAEIEYYWSGAVTKNSVVVCFEFCFKLIVFCYIYIYICIVYLKTKTLHAHNT